MDMSERIAELPPTPPTPWYIRREHQNWILLSLLLLLILAGGYVVWVLRRREGRREMKRNVHARILRILEEDNFPPEERRLVGEITEGLHMSNQAWALDHEGYFDAFLGPELARLGGRDLRDRVHDKLFPDRAEEGHPGR